jgi:hypothetical protein
MLAEESDYGVAHATAAGEAYVSAMLPKASVASDEAYKAKDKAPSELRLHVPFEPLIPSHQKAESASAPEKPDPGELDTEVERRGLVRRDNSFSSRHQGVRWDKTAKQWGATIKTVNLPYTRGKGEFLGWFDTEEEAKARYNARYREFGREPDVDESSDFRGVCWQKNTSTWDAGITVDGNTKHLGSFEATVRGEVDAALAYDAAARAAGRPEMANFKATELTVPEKHRLFCDVSVSAEQYDLSRRISPRRVTFDTSVLDHDGKDGNAGKVPPGRDFLFSRKQHQQQQGQSTEDVEPEALRQNGEPKTAQLASGGDERVVPVVEEGEVLAVIRIRPAEARQEADARQENVELRPDTPGRPVDPQLADVDPSAQDGLRTHPSAARTTQVPTVGVDSLQTSSSAAVKCSNSTANANFLAIFTSRNAANAAAGDAAISEQGAKTPAPANEITNDQTGQTLPMNPRKRLGTVLAMGFDEGVVNSEPESPEELENSMLVSRKGHAGQQQDQLPSVSRSGPQIRLLQDAPSESSQGSEVNGAGPAKAVVPTKRTAAVITPDAIEHQSGQLAAAGARPVIVEVMADDAEVRQAIVDDGVLLGLLQTPSDILLEVIEDQLEHAGARTCLTTVGPQVKRPNMSPAANGGNKQSASSGSTDPAAKTAQKDAPDSGAVEVEVKRRGLTQRNNSSSSRYKGVVWCKQRHKWKARIGQDGETESLGYFASEEEAKACYDARCLELGRDPHLATSSGFRGVSWHKVNCKWKAAISLDGNITRLGYFERTARGEVDAALAYDAATRAAGRPEKANFESMPQHMASPDPAPPPAAPAAPAAFGIGGSTGPAAEVAEDDAPDPGALAAEVEGRGLVRQENSFTSRHTGVCWHKQKRKWHAQIVAGGKQEHLGLYATEAEAKARRDARCLELGIDPHATRSSTFRGVTWNKTDRKWHASIKVDYKPKHLGTFEGTARGEVDAALAHDAAARAAGRPEKANFEPMPQQPVASPDAAPPRAGPAAPAALGIVGSTGPAAEVAQDDAPDPGIVAAEVEGRGLVRRDNAFISQHKGVSWDKKGKRWQAQLQHGGQRGHLGYFATEEEAKARRDARCLELGMDQDAGTSSGFRGVHWDKRGRKWKAQIKIDGKDNHLGYFDATARGEVDAALAYDVAVRFEGRPEKANFETSWSGSGSGVAGSSASAGELDTKACAVCCSSGASSRHIPLYTRDI